MPIVLEKWSVIRVWCPECKPPHYKYSICVCPINQWFLFVNSELPFARKARQFALTIERTQANFVHHTSYVDTTKIEMFYDDRVSKALNEAAPFYETLMPTLKTAIQNLVNSHNALAEPHKQAILES